MGQKTRRNYHYVCPTCDPRGYSRGMTSPPVQSPERARLRRHIEARVEELDLTWSALSARAGIPYETIRRVRIGTRPISRAVRVALEDGLQWGRGSIRAILAGGDPTPATGGALDPGPTVDTAIGPVEVHIARDLDTALDGLTTDQAAEIERRLAERMRTEAPLFVELLAREMRQAEED